MKKLNFLVSIIKFILLILAVLYLYNKFLFINNNSKLETTKVVSNFKIRPIDFYISDSKKIETPTVAIKNEKIKVEEENKLKVNKEETKEQVVKKVSKANIAKNNVVKTTPIVKKITANKEIVKKETKKEVIQKKANTSNSKINKIVKKEKTIDDLIKEELKKKNGKK